MTSDTIRLETFWIKSWGKRDQSAVSQALQKLESASRAGRDNLMPYIVEAVRAYATLGEMCNVLRGVYGEYREPALV